MLTELEHLFIMMLQMVESTKMLHAKDVARAIMYCYKQPKSVLIKELDMENNAGIFKNEQQ